MEIKIVKDFRFLTLLLLFLLSTYLLLSSLLQRQEGVIVTALKPNSKCSNVEEGFVISEVRGKKILSLDDFEAEIKNIKKGEYVVMKANGMAAGCFAIDDGYIGIDVEEISKRGLRFSSEIVDSRVNLFEIKNLSKKELKKVSEILKIRSDKLKLPQTYISLSDSLIKITNPEELNALFAKCKFEMKISHKFDVKNAFINIGNASYELKFYNESFEINNSRYSLNQSFYLEGIKFDLLNVTNTSAVYYATVVSNEDIANVLSQLAFIRFDEASQNYILNLPLKISEKAEKNVKNILKNVGSFSINKQVYLRAEFLYFLDNVFISSIPVPREFRREASVIPVIALKKSLNEVNEVKKLLDACLSSSILDYKIEKVASEIQKGKFASLAKILVLVVVVIIFIPTIKFYRKIKNFYCLLPSILLVFEVITMFGIASLTQLLFSPGWIVDLPTLFGLVAVVVMSLLETFLKSKKLEIGKYIFWLIGFSLLFTPFKGFGLAIVFWTIINITLVKPLVKNFFLHS